VNATEFALQTQTIDIIDDDIIEVLLAVNTGSMNESGGMATFTVYTSGDVISSTGVLVTLAYTGTATNGVDYATGSVTVTIAPFTTGIDFTITGINDILAEGNEDATAEIASVVNGSEYGTQVQNVTILDDDAAQILLEISTGNMAENDGVVLVTLRSSGDVISLTGVIITLAYSGTAIDGSDYTT